MNAGRFEQVFEQIACGRLAQARQLLKPLVNSNPPDPDAMFTLGRVRWEGRHTDTATKEAFDCFNKAAGLGHRYGKLYAAVAYLNGIGVRKNRKKGLLWLEDCADLGCAGALHELAELYLQSDGAGYSLEKAIARLTEAANLPGIAYSGEPVRFIYCTSLDEFVESNEAEAIAKAQEFLAYLYSGQEEDVPRNASLAAKWAAKAVANKFDEYLWPLIELYLELGNEREAKVLLLDLVRKHDPRAMFELARMYETSDSKDEQNQVYRLKIAARKGGYVQPENALITPVSRPKKSVQYFPEFTDFSDENGWPDLLSKTLQAADNDHNLRIMVRAYNRLAAKECEEARRRLNDLIAEIGESKYLALIRDMPAE